MAFHMDDVDDPKKENVEVDVNEDEEYTFAEQRKIIHKVDRRLLTVLGLMQAVSFLDRANMSNAAVAGMTKELQMGIGNRYSTTLLVFFGPYILLQFPAAGFVRKCGPRLFLSSIVLIWGIVMICFGFARSWKTLIGLRMLLGALEAGCFPAQYYLIQCWYSRFDLAKRNSVFYLIGVLGSALGGVLALLFSQMQGLANYDAWRWIFIMEGIITCLIGLLGFIYMVDFPDQAHKAWKFLTEKESAFIVRRINRDRQDGEPENFAWRKFMRPATDFKVWCFALLFFCSTIQAYSVGFYLPIILEGRIGFSKAQSQALSTPPYLTAMLLMFGQGWLSDRCRIRAPFLYFNACLCSMGLCLMCWTNIPGVQYFGSICVTAGASANMPAVMVYQANNIRGPWKRAFCSASMISFGGTGGIAGSLVFRAQDKPEYVPGIIACLTANGVIILTTTILTLYFLSQNRRASSGATVIEKLPSFRYTI
ncbi:phthalate transporter [Paraphoma chrysanthemicola]|nr:phthalate transporter [Paraphoma chrysanthemicola]